MREAVAGAVVKWETWVVVAYNILAALMAQGIVPEQGKLHTAAMIASVVLTNVLALLGRQVLTPRNKTRASDLAETVEELPAEKPKRTRKKVQP